MVSLVIASQGPFDLQLTSLPTFAAEMTSLVHLEVSNHSFVTIPTYFVFSFPNLETLKLHSNGLRSFLTSEEKPAATATIAPESRPGSTGVTNPNAMDVTASDATINGMTLPSQNGGVQAAQLESAASSASVSPSEEAWRYESVSAMVQKRGTPKLRHLDLSNNALTVLPAHIAILSNLTYLDLSNNWIRALPEELTSMPIATLLVENNQIFDLPIANALSTVSPLMYSSLTELNISSNHIKLPMISLSRTLLPNLAHYSKISRLELAYNTLSTLPPAVLSLAPRVTSLNLSHISLRSLVPAEIKSFAKLRVLDLSHNSLTSLPSELCMLVLLEALDVSHNELVSLPQGLPGLCHNLVRFYLGRNKLRSLPVSFCTLTKLTHLDLGGNLLSDGTFASLAPLTALERLDLRANAFTTLPNSLAPLSNLVYLSVASNPLQNVPVLPFFGKLEELDLNETPTLNTLPKLCSELSTLRCIHVGQTIMQFESVSRHHKDRHTRFPSNTAGKNTSVTLATPPKRIPSGAHERNASVMSDKRFGQQRKVEVAVLDAEKIDLTQLISLMRSCPHEILIGGMAKLCMDSNWHSQLLKANLVSELSFLLLSSDLPLAQVRTLMAIKTICKNLGNHNFIGEDKQILGCLADIITTNLPKATREKRANLLLRLALDSLCYLSYDPSLRKMINHTPTDQSVACILSAVDKASNGPDFQALSSATVSVPIDQVWQSAYGLTEMIRYLSMVKDIQLSSRAKRTMAGIGLMPEVISPKRGIRILSIDGGGSRGFIVLAMLSILERVTGKKISEMFDLILGTSTGGLISSLVAWSPISMEEAKPYYRILCKTIFTPKGQPVIPPTGVTHKHSASPVPTLFGAHDDEDLAHRSHGSTDMLQNLASSGADLRSSLGASDPFDTLSSSQTSQQSPQTNHPSPTQSSAPAGAPEDAESVGSRWLSSAPWQRLTGLISMLQTRAYYETSPMEQVLKDMAGEHVSLLDTAMYTTTKFAAVCAQVNAFPPQPYILRNYNHPDSPASKEETALEGNSTFRVWEAVRATAAAPGYFDPVIKDNLHLVDGAMIYNNPIALAIMEAKALWPDRPIGCLVSCGTGARPSHHIDVTMGSLLSDIVDSATETEKTAMLARAALSPDVYFRLQPRGEVFDFPIDECRPERFDDMEKFMSTWLEENGALFLQIAEALKNED